MCAMACVCAHTHSFLKKKKFLKYLKLTEIYGRPGNFPMNKEPISDFYLYVVLFHFFSFFFLFLNLCVARCGGTHI